MGLKYERLSIRNLSWRAAAVATAAVASVVLTGVGPAGAIPSPNAKIVPDPPAHQMAELNFLLGNYTCSTVYGVNDHETTRKILDGNYYQQTSSLDIPGIGTVEAVWTLSWDPVYLNFNAQYFDNIGNSGTGTSPGWQDGNLKVTGTYVIVDIPGGVSGVGAGTHDTGMDDFQIVGPGHYTDTSYTLKNGKWVSASVSSCRQA